ncbi:hypothetical protein [Streptomyces sp. CA-106131]|uniref:hypothetical protein n=1 Tax=Streptomyces sp. CA-106131 TaxID=3240045 RepID=UPI003D93A109
MHGYHGRKVTDVPVDGRQVVDHLRVRRLDAPMVVKPLETGLFERFVWFVRWSVRDRPLGRRTA